MLQQKTVILSEEHAKLKTFRSLPNSTHDHFLFIIYDKFRAIIKISYLAPQND